MKKNKLLKGIVASIVAIGTIISSSNTNVLFDLSTTSYAISEKLDAPKNYSAQKTKNSITLKWDAVVGADAYRVYKYNETIKKFEQYKNVAKNSCKITNLSSNTKYTFKVAALVKSGNTYKEQKSSKVSVKTSPNYPSAPSLNYTGFGKTGGKTYYFEDGKNVIGWKKINNKTYYFSKDDAHMLTGTVTIDGKQYTFNSNGEWDGVAGKKPTNFKDSCWEDSLSTVQKAAKLYSLNGNSNMYYSSDTKIEGYSFLTYYLFDDKNKLYSGLYILDDSSDNIDIWDSFSSYYVYTKLIEVYKSKYGTPDSEGIHYYSSRESYAKKYLYTWDAIKLGYAYGKARWSTSDTDIIIDIYEDDDITPVVTVTYKAKNYTPVISKTYDTSNI